MNLPAFTIKPTLVALMALMAATRFHHFGSALALPDASWAVFFLAGLWLGGRYVLAMLLIEAVVIDYLAIHQLGVSDFCVSAAYVFLLPAYAALWLGGRYCRAFALTNLLNRTKQFLVLVVATSGAFLISNASFFLLSGRFPQTGWAQYVESFTAYYPGYLQVTLLYVIVIFSVVNLFKSVVVKNLQQTA